MVSSLPPPRLQFAIGSLVGIERDEIEVTRMDGRMAAGTEQYEILHGVVTALRSEPEMMGVGVL